MVRHGVRMIKSHKLLTLNYIGEHEQFVMTGKCVHQEVSGPLAKRVWLPQRQRCTSRVRVDPGPDRARSRHRHHHHWWHRYLKLRSYA